MIEQIMIKRTLKAGNTVWLEGSIIDSPLPKVLIEEAERGTGTVEVTKGDIKSNKTRTIFVAQRVDGRTDGTTSTTSEYAGLPKVNKPKPKLRRRK